METRRTPRSSGPSSATEKPKAKRGQSTEEKSTEEVGVGRRTRSKAGQNDPEKSVFSASGLEDSEDEASDSERRTVPMRTLRSRKSETTGSGDETYSSDNISTEGGPPGRYKCPDCVKSFAFAGGFVLHRREHLQCKTCSEQFNTEAALNDHIAQNHGPEVERKRRRVSDESEKNTLSCGETLADSPEPPHEDGGQTIGFAPGSEPPPMMEGNAMMEEPLSGTDTPELPGSKRKRGKDDEIVEICRVVKPPPPESSGVKKSFVCSQCGLQFRTKNGLAVHMGQHESGELEGFVDDPRDKQTSACTLCDLLFATSDELDDHLVKAHNIKLNVSGLGHASAKKGFKCAYCETLVEGKHELNTHVKKVHFGFKYYSCPMCNKSLRDANSLNFHIKWVHMAEKFDCPLCPRAFRSEEGLRNHLVGNHTKTFDPRLFGLEVTDDKEPKLRRRGMRSVSIIRRRKATGPRSSSGTPSMAVGTAMTNQADIIAPINAEFGVQEEIISPDGTPGAEMETRFYPRCDSSGLPLKGSGLINGRKYKFIRTVGDSKLFYDKKGEIIGTELDAARVDQCDSPTPSNEAEGSGVVVPYKEEKLKISNVRIKIMSF